MTVATDLKLTVFTVPSPVGLWSVTLCDDGILSVDWLEGDTRERVPEGKLAMQAHCMLSRYFQGEQPDFHRLPLVFPRGTNRTPDPLVARVMRELLQIPHGTVYDYQWLAGRLGIPKGPRAVGQALGRNPIPVIVPCHRIVARDRKIGGFMRNHPDGGRVKRFLLELEGHRFSERNGGLLLH